MLLAIAIGLGLAFAMPYSTALKNAFLNAGFRNVAGILPVAQVYASLHTADPGDSGTSEVTGGSPAYARKAANFAAASAGAIASSNAPVFDVPAGTTITHVGYWTAASAGTYLGNDPVTSEAFAAQGTYTLTSAALDLNA